MADGSNGYDQSVDGPGADVFSDKIGGGIRASYDLVLSVTDNCLYELFKQQNCKQRGEDWIRSAHMDIFEQDAISG
mgnify:CR=1 FL=1